jgi:glycyl-tRNA synthetase beta subunit
MGEGPREGAARNEPETNLRANIQASLGDHFPALRANSDLLHQFVGFAVGLRDPLDNLRGFG